MPALPSAPLRLARIEAFVFRSPIATPVRTSFGTMHDRPAVFIRVEDTDGAVGWGETWCNFPSVGAEHRARLVESVFAPLATSRGFDSAAQAYAWLDERTAVLAIQSGEYGPMAQALAGIDLALWDLCARRAGLPLWRYLGGHSDVVRPYASGINPDAPEDIVAARRAEGYGAFKLKIGFGEDRDLRNLRALRELLGASTPLLVDANQGWSLDEALRMAPKLDEFGLGWLEEPLRADRPWAEWQQLQRACAMPLAAGENVVGDAGFDAAIASRSLTVLQPDLAKWGGISACWPIIDRGLRAGLRYCPHYLGAGLGLLASAHVLAATGADGWLEVDSNPNPLRTELMGPLRAIEDGVCRLGEAPGIGVDPDLQALAALTARRG
ncbi:mandelate racemase/muconate lactonizing enzyme family protein [Ramlibacter sp. CrO1]|uniref:Mandelate racemase/muconate lactonizing enzyme family protein n=1 Tax=Ramlibacter algicola TaxID=2795217 RepID=A0A934Q041_9BURK|nr:mandelate racemase/muconate lactonizing enzyme family protein [Ramlibacter algicola]MBK0392715.1 mandelate racemase/muconate lactonizing enzyme family protein [Ramlibacter algicola]